MADTGSFAILIRRGSKKMALAWEGVPKKEGE
jgi:hypothetical protein